MATTTSQRASARDRLLEAANELFYEEGVHTVGIDRVIERAGVAKASLYSTFGSKDELIRAYLEARHAATSERMERELAARFDSPRDRLLGVFEVQAELFGEPGFRGCAFMGASAESTPGSAVQEVSDQYRTWIRTLFLDLANAAGARDPRGLAQQLVLLYDGAGISAWMDHDPSAGVTARAAAEQLVEAQLAPDRAEALS